MASTNHGNIPELNLSDSEARGICRLLHLATIGDLPEVLHQHWSTFEPIMNERLNNLEALCIRRRSAQQCARDRHLLFDPLAENAVGILAQLISKRGVIVCGDKCGGKSQQLKFIEHVLRQAKVHVARISLKGTQERPTTLWSCLDVLLSLLPHEKCFDLLGITAESLTKDNFEQLILQARNGKRMQGLGRQVRAFDLAADLLMTYARARLFGVLHRRSARETLSIEVTNLKNDLIDFFGFLEGVLPPLVLIFDEAGELLNPATAQPQHFGGPDVFQFLTELVRLLDEEGLPANTGFIMAGSTYLAKHVKHCHLEQYCYVMKRFTSQSSQAFWHLWKQTMNVTEEEEKTLLDMVAASSASSSSSSPPSSPSSSSSSLFSPSTSSSASSSLSSPPSSASASSPSSSSSSSSSAIIAHSDFLLGEALVSKTAGVPGYLLELFLTAIGGSPEPTHAQTLAAIVEVYYNNLVKDLSTSNGVPGAPCVRRLIVSEKWQKFAEHGLAPKFDCAPCGPVLREIFNQLRQVPGINEAQSYMGMLRHIEELNLTGSVTGGVFRERLLCALVLGHGIRLHSVKYHAEDGSFVLDRKSSLCLADTALLITYRRSSYQLSDPLVLDTDSLTPAEAGALRGHPDAVVFFAESETFPSIDMSYCKFDWKRKSITRYNISACVSTEHFRKHLALAMEKLEFFRSTVAQDQMRKYRDVVNERLDGFMPGAVIHDEYVVAAQEQPTDLQSPQPADFKQDYWFAQIAAPTAPALPSKAEKRKRKTPSTARAEGQKGGGGRQTRSRQTRSSSTKASEANELQEREEQMDVGEEEEEESKKRKKATAERGAGRQTRSILQRAQTKEQMEEAEEESNKQKKGRKKRR